MAVNPVTGIGGTNTNTPTATSTNANDPASQRNLFMTLLVAQLKNQDPLQPQDGTAFVAQLAQFNSLDQLVGIRQSIETLTSTLNTKSTTTSASTPAPTPTTTPTTPTTTPRPISNMADLG